MLITFIICALILTAAGLALIVCGLVKKHRADAGKVRAEQNLALLRAQYAELEADYKAGKIPEDEYTETKTEIEHRVIEETAEGEESVRRDGRQGLYAAFVIVVAVPVLAFVGYEYLGSPQALDPVFMQQQQQNMTGMQGHSEADLMDSIKLLEDRLKENPDNADGWMMLAKTYASFKNWKESSRAFAEVNRLVPHNSDVLADWADVLAATTGSIEGKPQELIEEALKIDPMHWKALALMGTLCYDKRDFKGAVTYWERMRSGTEQGSEEWRQITENIEQARRMGGLPAETSALQPAPAGEKAPVKEKAAAPGKVFITGTVDVAPAMKGKLTGKETVFVFARSVTGSKMPVAFIRLDAANLPASFRLDGMSQMGMGVKTLADVTEAIVEARVSRSGNFMPGPGDLEGSAGTVKVGAEGVKIVIDRVVP